MFCFFLKRRVGYIFLLSAASKIIRLTISLYIAFNEMVFPPGKYRVAEEQGLPKVMLIRYTQHGGWDEPPLVERSLDSSSQRSLDLMA